jgi:hypothetical protein
MIKLKDNWNAYLPTNVIEAILSITKNAKEVVALSNLISFVESLRHMNKFTAGLYTNIHRDALVNSFGCHYKSLIQLAQKGGLLEVNTNKEGKEIYSNKLGISKGYRLGPAAVPAPNAKRRNVKKYLKVASAPLQEIFFKEPAPSDVPSIAYHDAILVEENQLFVDHDRVEEIIDTMTDGQVASLNVLCNGKDKDTAKIGEKSGRLYHVSILLSSPARKSLVFKSKKNGGISKIEGVIDIKCCHPTLISYALVMYNESERVVSQDELLSEAERWGRMISRKDFWTWLQKKTRYADKASLKEDINRLWNYESNSLKQFECHTKLSKWFAAEFPYSTQVLLSYFSKKGSMASELQRMESAITHDSRIYAYLIENNIKVLNEHDGYSWLSNTKPEHINGLLIFIGKICYELFDTLLQFKVVVNGKELILEYSKIGGLKVVSDDPCLSRKEDIQKAYELFSAQWKKRRGEFKRRFLHPKSFDERLEEIKLLSRKES